MSLQYTEQELQNFLDHFPKEDLNTYDLGNSHPHWGIFEKGTLQKVLPVDLKVSSWNEPYNLSSVRKGTPSSFAALRSKDSFMDMPVHYSDTLGHDRLICSYLLWHWRKLKEDKREIVLIDAGTFITADFINDNGFQGGYIYPGIQTVLKSYGFGENLPKDLKLTSTLPDNRLPQNTDEAILSGTQMIMKGLLKLMNKSWQDKVIILTGGHGHLLQESLKEATSLPHLIHYALYFQKVTS